VFVQHLLQGGALDVLHGVEEVPVLGAGVVEADDVGVVELAEDVDLALEADLEARLAGQFGGENLDGGAARAAGPRRVFPGEVPLAHAAAAQLLLDDPAAQPRADHGRPPVTPCRERPSPDVPAYPIRPPLPSYNEEENEPGRGRMADALLLIAHGS